MATSLPAPRRQHAQDATPGSSSTPSARRPEVVGKFLRLGGRKTWIRGVTYGTFRPGTDAGGYDEAVAARDFGAIAKNGFNAIRCYTVPPHWLLDLALEFRLHVMVGLPWEQHVAFLGDGGLKRRIRESVRSGVRACAQHPAVLCYTIGNEIPTSIVRWHGHIAVERFLKQLFGIAKSADPDGLVTYVNYPSTEYLELPFLDLVCSNVYLEPLEDFRAYLARLHNLAGDSPLLLGELGMDSRRNGETSQASILVSQVEAAFASGCGGAFIFAWTDEWHRGGHEVEDWAFGLTRRDRSPKPALAAVRDSLAGLRLNSRDLWPRISVIVCSYNGCATIGRCCEGLAQIEYPDFEVIVVDDGSTDDTGTIAASYGFRVITTENRGLSNARNTGLEAASGEVVAYIDDDAVPDPHWLQFLATAFVETTHVGVGGPNVAPPAPGRVADCVANAPGGPAHVLTSDTEAEHIPGCNMAFRKAALETIGGFDPQFRAAGDDVDICWRLLAEGWTLGFVPGAAVLHQRRDSIRGYWKQQVGYGKAEALLERKWPEKYNGFGHLTWVGRLYGKGLAKSRYWVRYLLRSHSRIYSGTWGSAAFQSRDEVDPGRLANLVLMPEWFLLLVMLAAFSLLGLLWLPLLVAVPFLIVGLVGTLWHAGAHGAHAAFRGPRPSRFEEFQLQALTAGLHLVQPVARLLGRLRYGLTPWRKRAESGFRFPWFRATSFWSERWQPVEARLGATEDLVRMSGLSARRGGAYDRWDLEIRAGLLGGARALFSIEEHGSGRQLARLRTWPSPASPSVVFGILLPGLAAAAFADGANIVAGILGGSALLLVGRTVWECGIASGVLENALQEHEGVKGGTDNRRPDAVESGPPLEVRVAGPDRPRHGASSVHEVLVAGGAKEPDRSESSPPCR